MSAMLTKMNWIEERQKVLAQNISNADTPGYAPMDVKPLDFKNLLQSSTSAVSLGASASSTPASSLAKTDAKHIGAGGEATIGGKTPTGEEKSPYEVSPAGNAVILEEQLIKMNQNYTDYQFTTNLYQKNMDMLKQALK
ncbi:MAG: flagellar basal body rod protein FlgB [Alphaproteobacteria bacterium]